MFRVLKYPSSSRTLPKYLFDSICFTTSRLLHASREVSYAKRSPGPSHTTDLALSCSFQASWNSAWITASSNVPSHTESCRVGHDITCSRDVRSTSAPLLDPSPTVSTGPPYLSWLTKGCMSCSCLSVPSVVHLRSTDWRPTEARRCMMRAIVPRSRPVAYTLLRSEFAELKSCTWTVTFQASQWRARPMLM